MERQHHNPHHLAEGIRVPVLRLPSDLTDLTHDEGLRTTGRLEYQGDGQHLPGAVALYAFLLQVYHKRYLHRSPGDGETSAETKDLLPGVPRSAGNPGPALKILSRDGDPERLITA